MSSKADYLKRYLGSGAEADAKKKKKSKHASSSSARGRNGLTIIEDDLLFDVLPSAEAVDEAWERQGGEDQPVTVEIITSSDGGTRGSWVEVDNKGTKRKIDDASPPRRRREEDASPPRRRREEDASPPRRRQEDASPPRRRREEDASPPRRRRQEDASPPRRRREEDASPRRHKEAREEDVATVVKDSNGRRTTTASGHNAGLQSFQSFGEKERELQKKKEQQLRQFGEIISPSLPLIR
jgi:hypothetical protein